MLILHFIFLAILVTLSWFHGLPYLEAERYIADIQYSTDWTSHAYLAALLGMCVNYFFMMSRRFKTPSEESVRRWTWAFMILGICSLPANTGDFFSYIEFGRLILVHDINPYVQGYSAVKDPYSSYTWFGLPTNYGPLTLASFLPAAYFSQISAAAGFIALKATWLAFASLCLWVLKKFNGWDRWFLLFVTHPLWLVEVLINGHNDVIAVFLILASAWALRFGREKTLFAFSGALSIFKLPLGIVPAFLALDLLKRRRWKSFFQLSAFVSALVGLILLAIGDETAIRGFLGGSAPLTIHSFPGRIAWVIQTFFPVEQSIWANVIQALPLIGAAGLVASLISAVFFSQAESIKKIGWLLILLGYLWGTQYWPWYGLWALPSVIVVRETRFLAIFSGIVFSGYTMYSNYYWEILFRSQKNDAQLVESLYILIPTFAFVALVIYALRSPPHYKAK